VKRADKDFGVAWARTWGKGRVFYCSLGHNHEIYSNPTVLKHYLAGLQWAIGDFKVDVKH
ncbi:MAG: ThuA domain-containing protein, partial [Verrucomicrobiales bacterium]